MIHLVTYADERMSISQQKCVATAKQFGCDTAHVWTRGDIPQWFIDDNEEVFASEFGAGFYIWKPFIIWQTMMKLNNGDILLYCDSGNEFISDVRNIAEQMDEDIFFFHNNWPHIDWCKGDVLKAILPGYEYGHGRTPTEKQVQASTIFFRVNQQTRDFVKEWLLWLQLPGFCDNSASKVPNYPSFSESRWDQSVLCCLQIKYGYKTHWFPTTTAHHLRMYNPEDNYPVLLNHHRKRNHEWASHELIQ